MTVVNTEDAGVGMPRQVHCILQNRYLNRCFNSSAAKLLKNIPESMKNVNSIDILKSL